MGVPSFFYFRARRRSLPSSSQENVLEPLTEIYNVPRVRIEGDLSSDLVARLERAMSCEKKVVRPKEETYQVRMCRAKGMRKRKVPTKHAEGKYYEEKIIWDEEIFGPING